MDAEVTALGSVRQGKLKVRGWARFQERLNRLKDGEVRIVVTRARATRSLAQNALYWAVYVEALAECTGYTPDEMHECLKAKFLPKTLAVSDKNGEIIGEFVIGGSTTRLNKLEFGDYLRSIKVWAETLGVNIPEPEDQ